MCTAALGRASEPRLARGVADPDSRGRLSHVGRAVPSPSYLEG